MPHLFVTIKVADTWPSADELDARNAVTDALEADGIGECTGGGGGLGEMDFSFEVADEVAARRALESTLRSLMPGAEFRIELMEDEEEEEDE
jgi:hypothetical protein